jgi:hypothetical protein
MEGRKTGAVSAREERELMEDELEIMGREKTLHQDTIKTLRNEGRDGAKKAQAWAVAMQEVIQQGQEESRRFRDMAKGMTEMDEDETDFLLFPFDFKDKGLGCLLSDDPWFEELPLKENLVLEQENKLGIKRLPLGPRVVIKREKEDIDDNWLEGALDEEKKDRKRKPVKGRKSPKKEIKKEVKKEVKPKIEIKKEPKSEDLTKMMAENDKLRLKIDQLKKEKEENEILDEFK